jgi:hypothetical protein
MGFSNGALNRLPVGTKLRLGVLASFCSMIMMTSGIMRGEAVAAEWSAEPSLSLKGEYNSNLLLFNGDNEVWGDWVIPKMKFKGATESLEIEANAKGEFVHYYGNQDRGLTNLYFPTHASYRWKRLTFGFDGGFTRDNTLLGELQQTGVVLNFTQRNLWTATPSLTVGLTERLSWQLGYHFLDASYQNGSSLGLVNYQVNGGSSKLSYNLRERSQVQITGDLVNFVAPDIDQTWTYYGAGIGLSHNVTKSIIVTASGGVRFVNTTQGVSSGSLSQNDVVWVYNASIRKEFERSTILLDGSSEVNPSGFGRLIQTDRVGGAISHNLTENLTASLIGGFYFVSGIATVGGQPFPDTRYTSVSPKLSWKFAQWWNLDVGYSYAERAVDSLNQWNFANSTFVMLTYGGPKWSVSR